MNAAMNPETLNEKLATRYLSILESADLGSIYTETNTFSGMFLPTVSEHYLAAQKKVLIVGKETRSWANAKCDIKIGRAASLSNVAAAMARHRKFLLSPPRDSKFMQFYRAANISLSGGTQYLPSAAIWSNLFCVSSAGKSPVGTSSFQLISELSRKLLAAQIDILEPDAIIFTTGTGYDKYLKAFFPERTDSQVITPRALWAFKINGVQCYRTSHPQWARGRVSREQALSSILFGDETPRAGVSQSGLSSVG